MCSKIFDVSNKESIKILYCNNETNCCSVTETNVDGSNELVIRNCLANSKTNKYFKEKKQTKKKKKKIRKTGQSLNCIHIPIKCSSDCISSSLGALNKSDCKHINISINFEASQKIKKIRFKKSALSLVKESQNLQSKCSLNLSNNKEVVEDKLVVDRETINNETEKIERNAESILINNSEVQFVKETECNSNAFQITVVQNDCNKNNIVHNILYTPSNLLTISEKYSSEPEPKRNLDVCER